MLITEIEEKLRNWALSKPGEKLETVQKLASQWHVAPKTISKVLTKLKIEGLVDARPGRGTWSLVQLEERSLRKGKKDSADDSPNLPFKKVSLLEIKLWEQIEQGILQRGESLPKQSLLAKELSFSTQTVSQVYAEFCRQGWAIKKGRRFELQVSATRHDSLYHKTRPLICMVIPNESGWGNLCKSNRTRRFTLSLKQEMEKYGVEGLTVLSGQGKRGRYAPGRALGPTELVRLTAELKDNLLGILILMTNREMQESYGNSITHFIQNCLESKKPIIWFDHANEADVEAGTKPLVKSWWQLATSVEGRKWIRRCPISESKIASLAADTLYSLGHRYIAFPNVFKRDNIWVLNRINLMRKQFKNYPEPVRIFDFRDYPRPLRIFDMPSLQAFYDIWPSIAPTHLIGLRDDFHRFGNMDEEPGKLPMSARVSLEAMLYMLPFHKLPEVTAFVFPSDEQGQYFYPWFRYYGLAVPKDYSLLSFDNDNGALMPNTLSSVELGFENAGYLCFHALKNDLPISPDADGTLHPNCHLNHMNTLGKNPKSI